VQIGSAILCGALILGIAGCGSRGPKLAAAQAKPGNPDVDVALGPDQMAQKEGIPLYPGSQTPSGESSVTSGAAETRYELVMITKDPIAKIADFYRQKIAGLDGRVTGETADFMGMTSTNIPIHITMGTRAGKTTIRAAAILENAQLQKTVGSRRALQSHSA
jgi:hypothetical protein